MTTKQIPTALRPHRAAPKDRGPSGSTASTPAKTSGPSARNAWAASERVSSAANARASVSQWLGRYRVVLVTFLVVMALFSIQRIALLAVYADDAALTFGRLMRFFGVGLRFDAVVAVILVLPQTMHLTFFTNSAVTGRLSRWMLLCEWSIAFAFVPFVCVAEGLFFDEFQSRFNYIAFEYLVYPHEVFGNIWETYPVIPLLAAVGVTTGLLVFLARRLTFSTLAVPLSWRRRVGMLGVVVALAAGLFGTSSVAGMQLSQHRVVNQCAGNGVYTFVYYAWTCNFDYPTFYLTAREDESYRRVRDRIGMPGDRFHQDSSNPVDRTVTSPAPRRDLNVVLIIEESFGSDYVGVLGDDRGYTPRFDELSEQGILFDNFYATGNRTARALEAILASFPPIPTEAILKRPHSDCVYTLAHVLAERGYETVFLTGGQGMFDGMYDFMTANGFQRFIEEDQIEDPIHTTVWGVCDEDTFRRTLQECTAMHASGRPFFLTVLTVTNHSPFTFPAGRIEYPSQGHVREYALKYSDWALGDFFEKARNCDFYNETVFVVLGDHGARVYGSQLFPMKSYRVPVLVLLPHGERAGTRMSTLACSMDIAPTIMGLLGGSYRSVFFGRDVFRVKRSEGYALMQHNRDIALLTADGRMMVLGCQKQATQFRMNPETYQLKLVKPVDEELQADTISFFQAGHRLYYDQRWFPSDDAAAK